MGNDAKNINGVKGLVVAIHGDERGHLGVVETTRDIGFEIRRIFYISAGGDDIERANHAVSAEQAFILLSGAVVIDIDNGNEQQTITLDKITEGLIIDAGIWRRLRNFAPSTLLLVAASTTYDETVYSDAPFFMNEVNE